MEIILNQFNYFAFFVLFSVGAFLLITTRNLLKKLIGLSLLQTSVLLFVISLGYVSGGYAPIFTPDDSQAEVARVMVNALPQVLMLTAIVVGLAVLAVGLALAIQIKKAYGSAEEGELK